MSNDDFGTVVLCSGLSAGGAGLDDDADANYHDLAVRHLRAAGQAQARLAGLGGAGVDTVVDLAVFGQGRDIRIVASAARASGVRVVVASGMHVDGAFPAGLTFDPAGHRLGRPGRMVEWFTRDIRDGVAGSGIGAGVLVCGISNAGTTADARTLLAAVARAHQDTGVAVVLRTYPEHALGQLDLLTAAGVRADRVAVSFVPPADEPALVRVMDAGFTVTVNASPAGGTVAALADRGYGDRIILSVDSPDLPADTVTASLTSAGVAAAVAADLLVANPRRLLTPTSMVEATRCP